MSDTKQPDPIKQAIIVNLDIPMGIGRLAAQAAHASWLAVLSQGQWSADEDNWVKNLFTINTDGKKALELWLKESFTKVMLRGWGDEMLRDLQKKAVAAGLPTGLMEEDGFVTSLAIGPAYTKDIDPITRHLHLL